VTFRSVDQSSAPSVGTLRFVVLNLRRFLRIRSEYPSADLLLFSEARTREQAEDISIEQDFLKTPGEL
jgi:hypothetical protein